MGEIIGIVSGKGGVGKTTITACLGSALSYAGHRVLLCDGDFGLRDLDLVLGVANEIIYDALDASEDKDYMDDAVVSIAENLDFLPASQSARWEDIGRKKYKKLVRRLCEEYDYILIDAPAGIGKGIEAILELVNRCIVVTHPLWVSLRNGARMIQVCQEHNIRDYSIAFNAVPIDGEDIHLYDMLEVLRAEYVGAIIPYDEDVLTYSPRHYRRIRHKQRDNQRIRVVDKATARTQDDDLTGTGVRAESHLGVQVGIVRIVRAVGQIDGRIIATRAHLGGHFGRVRFAFAGLIGRIGIRYYGNHAARVLTAGRVRDFQRML